MMNVMMLVFVGFGIGYFFHDYLAAKFQVLKNKIQAKF